MTINPAFIRTLSMLGQRGSFGVALTDIAKENSKIIALTADLCNTSGLDRFNQAYPDRLINVGIAEQNMIGIAAGLAAGGNIPFVTTFSNFASMRSCEQIKHFLGYMRENVKVVGFAGGFAMGMFGTTHYGIEDIACIRAINNLIILSPADGLEVVKSVAAAACIDAPVYIRLTGTMNLPTVYKNDFEFQIGKAIQLREGSDVTIIATGTMVHNSIKAAESLEIDGISTAVIDMHTLKPLDSKAVRNAYNSKLIVTVEEHSQVGGLGSSVAEAIASDKKHPPLHIVGVSQEYKHAGSNEYMLEQYGLTTRQIYENVKTFYREICFNDK
jgi:transketolase